MESALGKHVKRGLSAATDVVANKVTEKSKEKLDDIMDKVEERAIKLEDRLLARLAYIFLLLLSGIFFALAVYFLMKEYFELSDTFSFLISGVVILLAGFIVKGSIKNKHR